MGIYFRDISNGANYCGQHGLQKNISFIMRFSSHFQMFYFNDRLELCYFFEWKNKRINIQIYFHKGANISGGHFIEYIQNVEYTYCQNVLLQINAICLYFLFINNPGKTCNNKKYILHWRLATEPMVTENHLNKWHFKMWSKPYISQLCLVRHLIMHCTISRMIVTTVNTL